MHIYLKIIMILILTAMGQAPPVTSMAAEGPRLDWNTTARSYGPSFSVDPSHIEQDAEVDSAVINPFRKAIIGAEVPGIISAMNFEEGDYVKKGQVVVEISKKRYQAIASRAKKRLEASERALERAEKDADIKRKLLKKGAITQQELIQAESAVEIAEAETAEVSQALNLAVMDVRACSVRAPFSGYINKRFKHNYEPVGRLEKIFEIVDTSKVYAVANVPEHSLALYKKDQKVKFKPSAGSEAIEGKIRKVGKSLDPSSKTKKVYALIPNKNSLLEIGMSGALQVKK